MVKKIWNRVKSIRAIQQAKRILATGVGGRRVPREYDFEETSLHISQIFHDANIQNYFFTYGSSLALLRDGFLSVRQGDIDIAIFEDEVERFFELLQRQKRMILYAYITERLDGGKGRKISIPTPQYPFHSKEERASVFKCFDTLNLVGVDFYIVYRYSDAQYPKGYMSISDVPWGYKGKSCYHSFSEYEEGLQDFSFPSILYPEYMRKFSEKYEVPDVKYRMMKNVRSWLDRVYPHWDIRRMEEHSTLYYKNLLNLAREKNKIPGYYYQFRQNSINIYHVEDNSLFYYRYRCHDSI